MDQDTRLLVPIRSERDLDRYRLFLDQDGFSPHEPPSESTAPPALLRGLVGKAVRAEFLIGGRLYAKAGVLTEADRDRLVLNSCGTLTICAVDSLKFITQLHCNGRHR